MPRPVPRLAVTAGWAALALLAATGLALAAFAGLALSGRGGGAAAATVTTPTTGPDQTGPGSLPPSNSNTRSTVHRPR